MRPEAGHDLELPRSDHAAVEARAFVVRHYGDRLSPRALQDAQLVVSELATNALLHGQGRITLSARLDGEGLRLEVVDEGSGEAPRIREAGETQEGGLGLRIVDAVALRWGAHEGTTHVWAILPV